MKKKLIKLLAIFALMLNLTGCSFTTLHKDLLNNHIDGILTSMNFLAEISEAIDAKIESNSRNDDSVEITYDNGIVFTSKYNKDISQTCSFEGPKEIIDEKLMDYAETCFNKCTLFHAEYLQYFVFALG